MNTNLITTTVTNVQTSDITSDDILIAMWLHDKPHTTKRLYTLVASELLTFASVPLPSITLRTLQTYISSLGDKSDSTVKTYTMAIKSLFSYALKAGYIMANPTVLLKAPKVKDEIASKIMTQEQVVKMIALATGRDHAMLKLMYLTGMRAAEVASTKWQDINKQAEGYSITVYGKGNKTRYAWIDEAMYQELRTLDGAYLGRERYVFQSRESKAGTRPITTMSITRMVEKAAKRAGIEGDVSPHWLRHANASHALDNGASIAVVKASLGHESLETTTRYVHAKAGDTTSKYINI